MKKIEILFLLAILTACNPTVVFREPQPQGKKNLTSFPPAYRGVYMELDDSSIYIIKPDKILERYEENLANPVEEVIEDGDAELSGGMLLIKDSDLRFPVDVRNDSVFGRIVIYDTVFSIVRGDRLRKMGKDYFLNLPTDTLWMVVKLNFDRGGRAFLFDIDHVKEMELFSQYCNVEVINDKDGNPIKYILSPTAKELKKLLKQGTFTEKTEYLRLSQEDIK